MHNGSKTFEHACVNAYRKELREDIDQRLAALRDERDELIAQLEAKDRREGEVFA